MKVKSSICFICERPTAECKYLLSSMAAPDFYEGCQYKTIIRPSSRKDGINIPFYVMLDCPMYQGQLIPEGRKWQYGSKSVLCIDTGEVFESIRQAAKAKSSSDTSIRKCCRGERDSIGGLRWKFVNEK